MIVFRIYDPLHSQYELGFFQTLMGVRIALSNIRNRALRERVIVKEFKLIEV